MGLDMYLEKHHYVKRWDYMKPEELYDVTVGKGGKPVPSIKPERISSVVEQVGYWRKSNAIHAWFVANVQDGTDNCGTYGVAREQLQTLLNVVKEVLKDRDKASELLPTQSGFFFGGTDYDQYYFDDLIDTEKMLTGLLQEDDDDDFYYHSSW